MSWPTVQFTRGMTKHMKHLSQDGQTSSKVLNPGHLTGIHAQSNINLWSYNINLWHSKSDAS